jgi:hypothetical protein
MKHGEKIDMSYAAQRVEREEACRIVLEKWNYPDDKITIDPRDDGGVHLSSGGDLNGVPNYMPLTWAYARHAHSRRLLLTDEFKATHFWIDRFVRAPGFVTCNVHFNDGVWSTDNPAFSDNHKLAHTAISHSLSRMADDLRTAMKLAGKVADSNSLRRLIRVEA